MNMEWIKVSDRLPDFTIDEDNETRNYEMVIASDGQSVYVACCEYWDGQNGDSGEWHMYGDYGLSTVTVTHWMPLPSPPTP